MPLNNACLDIGATAMRDAIDFLSLHSGDPGAAGTSNTTTAPRQAPTWSAVANGDFNLTTAVNFTGGAPSGGCTYVGFWTLVTGGTFLGSQILTGDQTFNSAGEYTITALTVNGAST